MKKIIIALVVVICAGFFILKPYGIKDADFKEVVAYVKEHSSKSYVAMSATSTQTRYKPSAWLNTFFSTTYTATYLPEKPFKVVMLPWAFLENRSKAEIYAAGLKYLIVSEDDRYNEIIVKGYEGWNSKMLFEKRWAFPELPSQEPYEIEKRSFVEKVMRQVIPAKAPEGSKYSLESAILIYQVKIDSSAAAFDMTLKGVNMTLFDSWGARQSTFADLILNTAGIKDRRKGQLTILGEEAYDIDLIEKSGTKSRDAKNKVAEYSEAAMLAKGGERSGEKTILGRPCELWNIQDHEVCLWKQIPLLETSTMMGKRIVMQATELEENATVREARFEVPANINLKS